MSSNEDDFGGHVDVVRCFGRTIVTLYIRDMSLYDACLRN